MNWIDWLVMSATLLAIVVYGIWKTRKTRTTESYILGDRDLPWWAIGFSIMATQASAITFLSTPGQAFDDGMRFVQFYFGLPIAMVILSAFVIPHYYRLKVYTAYEYLEYRFSYPVRFLTALLFMVQRGLAAGLTIYAPSIVLSTLLHWDLSFTILCMGVFVILYTTSGGTNAVAQTQKLQMMVILGSLFLAMFVILSRMPGSVDLREITLISGKLGKMNLVDLKFDLENRYNVWSGIIGGTFLFLSYFGTDQSQVSRYLGGQTLAQSRLGLLFNGLVKVPMQFFVLFAGLMVYVFFLFQEVPVHYNEANLQAVRAASGSEKLDSLQFIFKQIQADKQAHARELLEAIRTPGTPSHAPLRALEGDLDRDRSVREEVKGLIRQADPEADTQDTDYIFLHFIIHYLPVGLIGLVMAMIFSAAWSSTSSELNALSSTFIVDMYRRRWVTGRSDAHYLNASKIATVAWGILALSFAMLANLFDNLIEAVNIVGSLFYGTILGIFLVAFFLKAVKSKAVFLAALAAETGVLILFLLDKTGVLHIAYLWLNLVAACGVVFLSLLLQGLFGWQDTKPRLHV